MSAAPNQSKTIVSRAGFFKAAAISLVGAGLGIGTVGQPMEQVDAFEPLVETCEKRHCLEFLLCLFY